MPVNDEEVWQPDESGLCKYKLMMMFLPSTTIKLYIAWTNI